MWHKMCRILMLPILSGLLLVSGCGNESSAAKPESVVPPEPQKMLVESQLLQRFDLTERFTLPGTVEAWEDLLLAAELAGPVRWIGPEEGASLKANQAILRIDPETVKANLQRERAAFELQSQEHARYQQLLANQLVSQQEYDRVNNALETARANLRQAELALDKSTCSSPVAGVLDRLLIDRGEYVKAGDPLAHVVQVDKLKVLVDLPEKDVAFLRPGQPVQVLAANLQGAVETSLPGEILHIGYQADPASRTYRVKIAIDNPEGTLRPGMILRVRFDRRTHFDALAIPLYALIDQDGDKIVFVENNGQAEKRLVETGAVVGHRVLVTAGLAAGDKLIVKGHQLLTDGAPVAVKGP
jgi:membrane fusion protein, multidrug efflux system